MDSNRKARLDRTRTPVQLNASEYHFKNSATKKFSPNLSRRPNLNETVNHRAGLPFDPKIKAKLTTSYAINYETECDIAYNDYLQALLRNQVVRKKIEDHKEILEGQMLVQNENLFKRRKNLQEIVNDTKAFKKQREIVEMIDFLQENIDGLKNAYMVHDMKHILKNFEDKLRSNCDTVILRHIKPLVNQQEYDKFINNLQLCHSAMEKIIHSGRDFDKVHALAEQIRNFNKMKDEVDKLQQTVSKLEKDAVYTFLKNTSDFFAMKYNNEVSD